MLPTMKQATGSNPSNSVNKVSIQLSLDGHSFSLSEPNAEFPGNAPVDIELLTPKTVLVPAELFDRTQGAELLAAGGLAPTDGECVVCSAPVRETVAVMALPAPAAASVAERFGSRASFTTPLLHGPETERPAVWLCRRGGLLYVRVYDPALQLAEVIPAAEDADVLYFIERLGAAFPLAEYVLHAAGDDAARLRRLLGKMFKESVCE